MEELYFDNKKYIPSKSAAKLLGYTSDYVSKLARDEEVVARKVGRGWYIQEDSIRNFSKLHVLEKERQSKELSEKRTNEYLNNNSADLKSSPKKSPYNIQKTVIGVFVLSGILFGANFADASMISKLPLGKVSETFASITESIQGGIDSVNQKSLNGISKITNVSKSGTASVSSFATSYKNLITDTAEFTTESGKTLASNSKKSLSEIPSKTSDTLSLISFKYFYGIEDQYALLGNQFVKGLKNIKKTTVAAPGATLTFGKDISNGTFAFVNDSKNSALDSLNNSITKITNVSKSGTASVSSFATSYKNLITDTAEFAENSTSDAISGYIASINGLSQKTTDLYEGFVSGTSRNIANSIKGVGNMASRIAIRETETSNNEEIQAEIETEKPENDYDNVNKFQNNDFSFENYDISDPEPREIALFAGIKASIIETSGLVGEIPLAIGKSINSYGAYGLNKLSRAFNNSKTLSENTFASIEDIYSLPYRASEKTLTFFSNGSGRALDSIDNKVSGTIVAVSSYSKETLVNTKRSGENVAYFFNKGIDQVSEIGNTTEGALLSFGEFFNENLLKSPVVTVKDSGNFVTGQTANIFTSTGDAISGVTGNLFKKTKETASVVGEAIYCTFGGLFGGESCVDSGKRLAVVSNEATKQRSDETTDEGSDFGKIILNNSEATQSVNRVDNNNFFLGGITSQDLEIRLALFKGELNIGDGERIVVKKTGGSTLSTDRIYNDFNENVNQALTGGNSEFSGSELSVTGGISGTTLTVSDSITGGSLSISGTSTLANLNVTGAITSSSTATSTFAQLEVLNTFKLGSDTVTDITGSGLAINNGVLEATGSGTSANANLLDFLDSTDFLLATSSTAFTNGTFTFNTGTTLDVDGTALFDRIQVGTTTATSTFAGDLSADNIFATTFIGDGSQLTGITSFSTSTTRSVFSNTATGLSYDNSTGITSLASGYNIPLNASTTEWNNKVSSQWSNNGSDVYYNGGNVGIGTVSPTRTYGGDTFLEIQGSSNPALVINDSGQSEPYHIVADSNDLSFVYGNDSIATFQNDGKVGIGTGSPNAILEVSNTGGEQFRIAYNSSVYTSFAMNSTGNLIIDSNSPGSNLSFTDVNVGIGTTTPISKLSVQGTAGTSPLTVASSTGDYLIRVSAAGNVGINTGTDEPGVDFQIGADQSLQGGPSNYLFAINSGAGVNAQSYNAGSGQYHQIDWLINNNRVGYQQVTSAGNYVLAPSGTAVFLPTQFGIGTSTPVAKLSVTGNGTGTGLLAQFADSNNTPRFTVLDNGNVGIGTDNPSRNFHVYSASGNATGFFETDSESGFANFKFDAGANTNGKWAIGVGGAGTASQYANKFYIASNEGSDSRLTIDGSNGNVGIGTTDPSYKLDVNGTGRFTGALLGDSSITGDTIVKTGGTSSQFLKADGSIDSNTYLTTEVQTLAGISLLSDNTAKSLYTMTSGVDVEFEDSSNATLLYLDEANKRVSIGDTMASKFSVTGTDDEVQQIIKMHTTQTEDVFKIQTSAGADKFIVDELGNLYIGGTPLARYSGSARGFTITGANNAKLELDGIYRWQITSTSGGSLAFRNESGNVNAFEIRSSGQMGINMGSQFQNFPHTASFNVNSQGSTGSKVVGLMSSNQGVANTNTEIQQTFVLNDSGGSEIMAQTNIGITDLTDGASDGKWTLQTRVNDVLTDRIISNSDGVNLTGNVGIGTNSPSELLTVGDSSTPGNLQVSYNANGSYFKLGYAGGTSNSGIQMYNANASSGLKSAWLVLGDDGRLSLQDRTDGLGFTSNRITFNKSTGLITTTGVYQGGDGSASAPTYSFVGDTNNGLFLGGTDQLGLSTAGTERLTIDSSGNVGIGTSNPNAPLSVQTAEQSSTREKLMQFSMSGLTDATTVGGLFNGTGSSGVFAPSFYGFRNDDVNKFVFSTNGYIGSDGDVAGYEPILAIYTAITDDSSDPTNGGQSAVQNRNLFGIQNSGSYKFVVDPDGNVGIGTTSPNNKLSVEVNTSDSSDSVAGFFRNSIASGQVRLQLSIEDDVSTTGNSGMQIFHTTGTAGLANYEARPLTFWTGTSAGSASQRMKIDTNGNVGIGTTDPDAPLHIAVPESVGGRENFMRITMDGDADTKWGVVNNTAVNGVFVPSFFGFRNDTTARASQVLQGYVSTASDLFSNEGVVSIQGVKTSSTSDPINGSLSAVQNKNIFSVYNFTSPLFTVAADGNVGIGTTSPARKLHVAITTDGAPVRFEDSNGYCEIDPTSTTWVCTSDERLKKNITSLNASSSLDSLLDLRPVSFQWNNDKNASTTRIGLIAQEVEEIFPDLVRSDSVTGYKSVAYGGFTTYLISAVKELGERFIALEAQVSSLAANISSGAGNAFNGIVARLTVGSATRPSGITLYDEETGEAYCLSIRGGETITRAGECSEIDLSEEDEGGSGIIWADEPDDEDENDTDNGTTTDVSAGENAEEDEVIEDDEEEATTTPDVSAETVVEEEEDNNGTTTPDVSAETVVEDETIEDVSDEATVEAEDPEPEIVEEEVIEDVSDEATAEEEEPEAPAGE